MSQSKNIYTEVSNGFKLSLTFEPSKCKYNFKKVFGSLHINKLDLLYVCVSVSIILLVLMVSSGKTS